MKHLTTSNHTKFKPHQLIIIAFLLAACAPTAAKLSARPTSVPSVTVSVPTNTPASYILAKESWLPSYPTCLIQSDIIYAPTPAASAGTRGASMRLSNGLTLQEGKT